MSINILLYEDSSLLTNRHIFVFGTDISLSNAKQFIEECIVTSKFDHPNLLNLIGVSLNPDDVTIHMIIPFMHHGDAKSFLKSARGAMIEFNHFPEVCTYQLHMRDYS